MQKPDLTRMAVGGVNLSLGQKLGILAKCTTYN